MFDIKIDFYHLNNKRSISAINFCQINNSNVKKITYIAILAAAFYFFVLGFHFIGAHKYPKINIYLNATLYLCLLIVAIANFIMKNLNCMTLGLSKISLD